MRTTFPKPGNLIPIQSLTFPEGIEDDNGIDICSLYLAGRSIRQIAKLVRKDWGYIIRVLHGTKIEDGMSIVQVRRAAERDQIALADYDAHLAAAKLVVEAVKNKDAKGAQKAAYGARQMAESYLDVTLGRKGSGAEYTEEHTVKTTKKVRA